jgi:hypothetical protein
LDHQFSEFIFRLEMLTLSRGCLLLLHFWANRFYF